jgi:hypothetical protein
VRRWVAAAAFSHELPEELLLKVLDEVARGEGGGGAWTMVLGRNVVWRRERGRLTGRASSDESCGGATRLRLGWDAARTGESPSELELS